MISARRLVQLGKKITGSLEGVDSPPFLKRFFGAAGRG